MRTPSAPLHPVLQWGRVPEDAEMFRGPMGSGSRTRGFNGAASLKTRKSREYFPLPEEVAELQWGRVPEDAEMGAARCEADTVA